MDRTQYEIGLKKARQMLSQVEFERDDCVVKMLNVLRFLDDEMTSIDMFVGARDAFTSDTLQDVNMMMCLCSPVTFMSKLRGLGFVTPIHSCMTNPTIYKKEILNRVDFNTMFEYDDRGAFKRALVGYIMEIPDEVFPLLERFMDLKIEVWNRCLNIAVNLTSKFSILPGEHLNELVTTIIESSYGDAIGSDNIGVETFYNKFISMCIVDIKEIGSDAHAYIINELTSIGEYIAEKMDWFWRTYPQRLMLYMRLKVQMYRLHPELIEDWSHLDRGDIFTSGKEKW